MVRTEFKSCRIFCAPPNNYSVVEGDNAHQQEGYAKFKADPESYREQLKATWQKVADELTRLGHQLLIPELDPEAPDQVFCADSVMQFTDQNNRRCVLLSHMNSPARQREVAAAERLFRKLGYIVYAADKDYKHEGTGDGLYAAGIGAIFSGYGPRSDKEAGQHIANATGKTVFMLPLMSDFIDDKYDGDSGGLRSKDVEGFHVDVLMQPLPTDHVICYWEGLPRFTQNFIGYFYDNLFNVEKHEWYSRLIKISKDDYEKFATNCLAVPDKDSPNGYTLFIPDDLSQKLKDALSELGYRLFEVDIEVARWSGGGLHCMFNVEYDFSSSSTRDLNYVLQFLIDKWTNPFNADWDGENCRTLPGLRVYRPSQAPAHNNDALSANLS